MASSEPLSFLKVGPQVRIRLPPARSQRRTVRLLWPRTPVYAPREPNTLDQGYL